MIFEIVFGCLIKGNVPFGLESDLVRQKYDWHNIPIQFWVCLVRFQWTLDTKLDAQLIRCESFWRCQIDWRGCLKEKPSGLSTKVHGVVVSAFTRHLHGQSSTPCRRIIFLCGSWLHFAPWGVWSPETVAYQIGVTKHGHTKFVDATIASLSNLFVFLFSTRFDTEPNRTWTSECGKSDPERVELIFQWSWSCPSFDHVKILFFSVAHKMFEVGDAGLLKVLESGNKRYNLCVIRYSLNHSIRYNILMI